MTQLHVPVQPTVQESFASAEDVRGLCVLVPVHTGGKTYAFLLDTGSSGVIFDEMFREELGKPQATRRLHTGYGADRVPFFRPPEAFLGSVDLAAGGLAGCADLSAFRVLYGCDVRGIVGMSVLRDYVVRIDFDRSEVELMTPDDLPHPEWGMAVPIEFDWAGIPVVTASVGANVKVRMDIDSGDNSYGDLSPEVFRRLGGADDSESREVTAVSLGGIHTTKSTRVTGLRIGHYTYRDLPFTEGRWSTLGLAFLARHRVTFDFPNRKMYLMKLMQPVCPVTPCISGLILRRDSGGLVVGQVLAGSPAGEAGVRPGDVVLAIDGADASTLEPWQAARLLMCDHDREVTLTTRRGREHHSRTFKLRRGL